MPWNTSGRCSIKNKSSNKVLIWFHLQLSRSVACRSTPGLYCWVFPNSDGGGARGHCLVHGCSRYCHGYLQTAHVYGCRRFSWWHNEMEMLFAYLTLCWAHLSVLGLKFIHVSIRVPKCYHMFNLKNHLYCTGFAMGCYWIIFMLLVLRNLSFFSITVKQPGASIHKEDTVILVKGFPL